MSKLFRFRFGSDTNLTLFEDGLRTRAAPFSSIGRDVTVSGYFDGLEQLAEEFGGWLISADTDYEATGGGQDAGFQDTAAQSTRANPPEASRGYIWPDYSAQIASQNGGFPARRVTLGQPVLPAGLNGRSK